MQNGDFYKNYDKAKEITQKHDRLQDQLKQEMNRWENLHLHLEEKMSEVS